MITTKSIFNFHISKTENYLKLNADLLSRFAFYYLSIVLIFQAIFFRFNLQRR